MPDSPAIGTEYAVVARSARPGPLPFVLKRNETFAVFDAFGDIRTESSPEQGIYHAGTRHVSRLELQLWGRRPLLLSSTVRDDNTQLKVHLTNPDVRSAVHTPIPRGLLYIERSTVLSDAGCCQRIRIRSYADDPVEIPLSLVVSADFRDVFEIRGMQRHRRGRLHDPRFEHDGVAFAYTGLDEIQRHTRLRIEPPPLACRPDGIAVTLCITPRGFAELYLSLVFATQTDPEGHEPTPDARPPRDAFRAWRTRARRLVGAAREQACHVSTSNEQFNDWLERSYFDVHMLVTQTEHGHYPYAGIPWYSAPFGRDGLITALQHLWIEPALARGVLSFLADTQADDFIPERDAQPGKILHETRHGEMANLGEAPFDRYYGSVDATPLFVYTAGAYHRRTGDTAFIHRIWPHIERALEWIDKYGDQDGDGYVEYTASATGLKNQGWKDSGDSVFHEDGTDATGPIALCEVQAYVYAAKRAAADLAFARGDSGLAYELQRQAQELREQFERDFWCEDLDTYVLALDGDKRPCRVRTSNAGHVLWAGLAARERAARVVRSLLAPTSYSGWGIRTADESAARYNPISYHNGSVWPHDNALIAAGFARYGHNQAALRVLRGMFDACLFMPMHRLPELFCGFARTAGEGPTLYPVACLPQAWASGAVFLLLQACLGLRCRVDGDGRKVVELRRPVLPPYLEDLTIEHLRFGDDWVDLTLHRYEQDVGVDVRRRSGRIDVMIVK